MILLSIGIILMAGLFYFVWSCKQQKTKKGNDDDSDEENK